MSDRPIDATTEGAAHAAHLDEIVAQRNLAVAQAVAAERESCAKVCDDAATWCEQNDNYLGEHEAAAARRQLRSVAQKIRARGKVTPEVESVDPLPTGSVVLDAKTAAHMADVCERAVKYIDAQSKPFIGMVALSALADMLRGKVTP